MKSIAKSAALAAGLGCMVLAQAGCATRAAPNFKGGWKPVNHYAETTQAIPLHRSYVFQPSPMDGTLKTMLTRWTRDSKMAFSYIHPSDFTLFAPVEQISTYSLEEAASRLNVIYAEQDIEIAVAGNQVVVRQRDVAIPHDGDDAGYISESAP